MKPARTLLPAFTVFVLSLLLMRTPALAQDACAEKLESNCTACHYLSRVCEKLGKKNESRWKRTISRMEKHGAKLSKEDKNILLSCLAEEKEGAKAACSK